MPAAEPAARTRRDRLAVIGWLALRGVRPPRLESQVRVLVATATVALALTCSALAPTAANVAQRHAAATPQGMPAGAQHSGTRFETADDYFDGRPVRAMRVASVGQAGAGYDGVSLPGPGELRVSPAAADLLDDSPDFAERYRGRVVGEVPRTHVTGPRDVVVWVGTPAGSLGPDAGWLVANPLRNQDVRDRLPDTLRLGYLVVVLGFILPLLALAAILASLGSRRRHERAAALHLAGVSRRDVGAAVLLEDLLLSAVSVVAGVAVFSTAVPSVAPSLPFGEGVWSADLAVDPVMAVGLVLGIVVLSATATCLGLAAAWPRAAGPRSRRKVLPMVFAGVLVLGLGALVASQLPVAPSSASLLLLAAMPACALGLAGALPVLVRGSARPLLNGSGPAVWAARVIQTDPARASRTGTGLTLLLMVAGLMMLFFPLMSDLNAQTERDLGGVVGEGTLVGTGPDSERSRLLWPEVREQAAAGAALGWYQPRRKAAAIFLVDCAEFADVVGVDEDRCRAGMLSSGRDVDLRAGETVALGRSSPLRLPASVTVDERVAQVVHHFSDAGGVVLQDPGPGVRPEAAGMVYLARPLPGRLETLRTAMVPTLTSSALTVDEQYRISTYTTRQFTHLLWLAIGLTLVIASLSTLVSTYDRVRATRPERRLLAIAGARRAFSARSLQLQTMLPLIIAVPVATGLSLAVSAGFVRLFRAEGGVAAVPAGELVALAGLCLLVPALAGALMLRAESREELLRTPE